MALDGEPTMLYFKIDLNKNNFFAVVKNITLSKQRKSKASIEGFYLGTFQWRDENVSKMDVDSVDSVDSQPGRRPVEKRQDGRRWPVEKRQDGRRQPVEKLSLVDVDQ